MRRTRIVNEPQPDEVGRHDGLAYTLWLPERRDRALAPRGVVVLHGAGSRKESHHDFARALLPVGIAALVFDARGHGDSDGPMDARAIDDVATMAGVLRDGLGDRTARIGLRGSSMGGFLALSAAEAAGAGAVVAICPASADGLARGVRSGRFEFDVDGPAILETLESVDLPATVEALTIPVMLMHAEGDEQVPVEHSRMLALHLSHAESRLVVVPGGHHRSIQHDGELQALSVRFLDRHLR